jgi:hypothetical protein
MIFTASNAPIKEIQVLFGHQKQGNPPLGSGLPEALKCSVTGWFTLYESGFCFPFFLTRNLQNHFFTFLIFLFGDTIIAN